MSIVQVFPSLWCWVWPVLSVESVGLTSVIIWGDRGEIRWCGLSKVWNGGEGCDLHGLWLVMLESAKDRVLGVDTQGQQVRPRVQYGMTCLLIRDAVGSVPCSDEWEIGVVTCLGSHGARGLWYRCWHSYSSRPATGKISIAMVPRTTFAKTGILPIVNLCNDM
jgi:hypothetical protein